MPFVSNELFPQIWSYYDCKEFKDFMVKYSLMTREGLLRQLRNVSNQHKNLNRYYEDLTILISEANYIDEFLINKKKFPGKQTTPALTISINLVTEAMVEHLKLGFLLDLYAPYELSMIFDYLTFICGILQNNRRIMIIGFCQDLYKSNMINFEDSDNQQFNKRRKKMTALQKLICDEFLFYKAIQEIYTAHAYFFLIAMKEGWIRNPLRGIFGKKKVLKQNEVTKLKYIFDFKIFILTAN